MSYYYIVNGERKNRFGFRKDVLINKYNCPSEKSEHDFCYEKGWMRIYDCGSTCFVLNL